jgi:signal transduction histidine kinase
MRLAESLPPISVIPNQMNMVFSNLVKLAMTEMPHGGTLTVTTRQVDSSLRIDFCNSVACHASAETDEIFLPSGVAKGLVPKGLGLYMVSNIVHRYGGDIRVSAVGGGNTFSILLPLTQSAPATEAPL